MFSLRYPVRYFPGWQRVISCGRRYEGNPTDEWSNDISQLPSQLQKLWRETHDVALAYYTGFPHFARGTAWHACLWKISLIESPDLVYRSTTLREPEQLIILSRLLEYVSVENAPQLTVVRFGPNHKDTPLPSQAPIEVYYIDDEPELLWEHEKKYLLAMPGRDFPDTCLIPDKKKQAYKQFKVWSKQTPQCEKRVDVPAFQLWNMGPADTFVYRSTKWTNNRNNIPGSQEYIHQFGPSVLVKMAENQQAFVFEGGKLDMIGAGIIN